MKDLHNNVALQKVIAPISPAATGTITGTVIDLEGYQQCEFSLSAGAQTTTGITVVPIVKEGDATGALTAVADTDLLGTEAGANLSGVAGAGNVTKIGYKGNKRYVSCDLVVAVAATGVYSANAVLGLPRKAPLSDQ